MHSSSRSYLVASEQVWLQPSPCSISTSAWNVEPPRKREELKAPNSRDCAFEGFKDFAKKFCGEHLFGRWPGREMPSICTLLLDPNRNFRCSPLSQDRPHNFGTRAAQGVQEMLPSSEQGGRTPGMQGRQHTCQGMCYYPLIMTVTGDSAVHLN